MIKQLNKKKHLKKSRFLVQIVAYKEQNKKAIELLYLENKKIKKIISHLRNAGKQAKKKY